MFHYTNSILRGIHRKGIFCTESVIFLSKWVLIFLYSNNNRLVSNPCLLFLVSLLTLSNQDREDQKEVIQFVWAEHRKQDPGVLVPTPAVMEQVLVTACTERGVGLM